MSKMKLKIIALLAMVFGTLSTIAQQSQSSTIILHMPYQNLSDKYVIQVVALGDRLIDVSANNYSMQLDDVQGTVLLNLCNRFNGNYQSTMGGTITFKALAGTKKMCPNMQDEQTVLLALSNANEFRQTDEGIELLQNGTVMLVAYKATKSEHGSLSVIDNKPMKIAAIYHKGERIELRGFDASFQYESKQGRVYGKAVCNRYFGNLSFSPETKDGGSIGITSVGSTLMACNDPQNLEWLILKALEEADEYQIVEGGVILLKQQAIVLELAEQ